MALADRGMAHRMEAMPFPLVQTARSPTTATSVVVVVVADLSFTTTAKVVAVLVAVAAVTMERHLGRLGIKATAAALVLLAVRVPCPFTPRRSKVSPDIPPTTAAVAADESCPEQVDPPGEVVMVALVAHRQVAAALAVAQIQIQCFLQAALVVLLEIPVVHIQAAKVAAVEADGAHPEALEETVVAVAEAKQLL